MIAVLKQGTTKQQIDSLITWFHAQGLEVHVSEGRYQTILGLIGIAMMTYFALINYGELTGGSFGLTIFGLSATVAIFLAGLIYANYLQKARPEIYAKIGRERI